MARWIPAVEERMGAPRSTPAFALLLALLAAGVARGDASEAQHLPVVEVVGRRASGDPEAAPASATVVPGDALLETATDDTARLGTLAPNLMPQPAGDRTTGFLAIRGLSNELFGDSAVNVYLDGIPYLDPRAAFVDLFDLDSVQVFRGPQPTRFGRASEAGAVNLVSRRIEPRLTARASVRYGLYDAQRYEAAASGPLGERVAFSLAGVQSRRGGYIENEFRDEPLDDRDQLAGRGRLIARPLPGLAVELLGEVQHADEGPQAFVLLDQPDPYEVRYDTDGFTRVDRSLAALRADWTVAGFEVTSIAARHDFDKDRNRADFDFSPRPLVTLGDLHRLDAWTEELRVRAPVLFGRLRTEAGFWFEDRTTHPRFDVTFVDTAFIQAPPPAGLGLPFAAPVVDRLSATLDDRTLAGFGEATVAVTPAVEAIAGLRRETHRAAVDRRHRLGAPADGRSVALHAPFRAERRSSAWLPAVTVAWRPRPTLLGWAGVSRGFRPAGFATTVAPEAIPYRAERAWSWEAGVKHAAADERVTAALALFWTRVSDYQVRRLLTLGSIALVNAERVTTRGVELELGAHPLPGLDLGSAFGWIDARFDDFTDPLTGTRFDGNALGRIPEYTLWLHGRYRHPRGAVVRVDWRRVGGYPFLEDNARSQDAYGLLGARVGWEWSVSRVALGIAAYVENAMDTVYFPAATRGVTTPGYDAVPGDPRTFGLAVTASF